MANESGVPRLPAAGLIGPDSLGSFPARFKALLRGGFGTSRGWVRSMLGEIDFLLGRVDRHLAPDLTGVHRLVFVCLGNINRSAFADKLAASMGLAVASIGLSTTTGAPAFPTAVMTAKRFGIDLGEHRATDLSDYVYVPGDLLLVMEVRHVRRLQAASIPAEAIALLGHWATPHRIHIHDPHTLSDAYFRSCFSVIQSAVRELAADCRAQGSPCLIR